MSSTNLHGRGYRNPQGRTYRAEVATPMLHGSGAWIEIKEPGHVVTIFCDNLDQVGALLDELQHSYRRAVARRAEGSE